jgi:hypothetical protein
LDHQAEPYDQPAPELLDHLYGLVTNFSNDCSKFEQVKKSSELGQPRVALACASGIRVDGLLAKAAGRNLRRT